ncbi:hypothetical protein ACHAO4_007158 [Trichoderma viride]
MDFLSAFSSWADNFVAQRPATISRAWCRVPAVAGPLTIHRGRTIMKRVGRSASARAVRPQTVAAVEATEDPEETQRASRRRLNSFVPPAHEAELELTGSPLSRAEVVGIMVSAKVNVANCFLNEEHTNLPDQKLLAKQSTFSKLTVPLKRRFRDYSSIDFDYASGGNRIAIFSELDPLISKALQTGVTEIDVSMASVTEAAASLQSTRRNPRTSLAASGAPDLSDIADVNEPSSPLALEPNESKSDAKSPTKRATQSPSPTKSNKSFRKRLSDTIVKLLPASSPRAEPSPIKPASPPTAQRDDRERRGSIIIRSPNTTRSPLSSNSTPGLVQWPGRISKESPFARWRPKRESEPITRLSPEFPSPSRNEYSPVSSIAPESPTRHIRPREPTPSKWHSFQPSTPSRRPSSTAATHKPDDELELVKSLPAWMQHTESASAFEACDLSNIDFGPASPSFTGSVSWMNSPESATESERTRIIRRRKSEPLFRNLLKTRASRRISLSPQKTLTASRVMPTSELFSHLEEILRTSDISNVSAAINSLASSSANVPEFSYLPTAPVNAPNVSSQDTSQQANETMDVLTTQYKDRMKAIMRATGSTLDADDVFKPDNEQTAVERLAKMAETQCNGHAKVVVAKEHGRLFVRFKLPFEYSHLFPASQGADETHYSNAPSTSKSPRVQAPRSSPKPRLTEDEMWELEEELYVDERTTHDKTIVVSDFGSSPVKGQSTTSPAYDRLPSSSPAQQSATSPAYDRLPTSSPSLPPQDENDVSLTFPDVSYELEGNTTIPGLVNPSPGNTPKTPIQNIAVFNSDGSTVSFKAVNRKSALTANAEKEAEKSQPAPSSATTRADSPERDYMRDFIRRSKHRRPSTTALGSPIAQNQRQPLGARSPNMETQQPEKRKFESSEGGENEAAAEPAAKKIRRTRSTPPKPAAAAAHADSGDEDPLSAAVAPPAAPIPAPSASDSSSRRSTRLRARSAIPKPSGPAAPVRVGRPAGRPRRTEQGTVDVVHQTRANTRRNKGKAEYPAQVLARQAKAAGEAEEVVGAQGSDQPAGAAAVPRTRRGKGVVWKEPLADFHEEAAKPQAAKPKRGRPAGTAGSKTAAVRPSGANRVSKPAPKVSAATARQRTSRLAAGLGMAGNGTPAPKRATRASTRSRK